MADTKLSALTELAATPADDDEVYIRDISEPAADESKRITVANLIAGAGGGATIVRKTADEVVNDNSTYQNDDHLLLAVGVNEVWDIFISLDITTSSTPDWKGKFTVPTGGSIYGVTAGSIGVLVSTSDIMTRIDFTGAIPLRADGAITNAWVFAWCRYVGGANAGNLQFQWAQRIADASDTTLHENSHLIAHKIS